VPIIAYFAGDVQSYLALRRWWPPLPQACPGCGTRSALVGHGSYLRYVAEESPWLRLGIPRFRCRACGHTCGVLPSFLAPRRHYSAGLIQRVLSLHEQLGLSRRQLSARFHGVPALSTCLAWIRAFGAKAHLWLNALLSALTRFDPGYDPLRSLVSPVGLAPGPPRLLLDMLPALLVAPGMASPGPGLSHGLGLLLLWGQNRHLPRLV